MQVGVGDLTNYTNMCTFMDLVGVGDLKIPAVIVWIAWVFSNYIWMDACMHAEDIESHTDLSIIEVPSEASDWIFPHLWGQIKWYPQGTTCLDNYLDKMVAPPQNNFI